jgi:hypothetical protein
MVDEERLNAWRRVCASAAVLVALQLLLISRVAAAADDAIEMQRLVPVVYTQFDGSTAPDAGGTGIVFAVTPERMYVVTAAHVVRKQGHSASGIELRFGDGRNKVPARLVQFDDKGLDIAVLVVDQPRRAGLDVDDLPFDRIAATGSARRGDPVFMMGRRGERLSVNVTPDRVSIVSDVTIAFETNFIVPGFSGGPLFNDRWQLLGVIVRDNVPEGEARAMPAVIGQLKQWGLPVDLRQPYVQVAAGSHVSCRIGAGSAAKCWGALEFDDMQLSDDRLEIEGVRWKALSVGHRHLCGVDVAGAAWCLGQNPTGQLGTGGTVASMTSAVRVAGALTFMAVSAGGHSCGLTSDGSAWCWGQGDYGQLGNDSNDSSAVPAQVAGARVFRSISAGLLHSCGVTTDGRAWCWGANELAPFSASERLVVHTPLAMPGDARFVTIGAGYTHTCALSTDGTALCWGQNEYGQLGDGTNKDSSTPVRVIGAQRFRQLSTAVTGSHNCALTVDGTAWCWGSNGYGQLGNGSETDSSKPVALAGDLKFVSISAGRFHTCAVTRDDAVWCWGGFGGLGTAHPDGSTTPVRVDE